MRIHGRNRALIGALAAIFMVAIPGTAFAGHDLGIYKVEKHVDIDSDQQVVDLSCDNGDYALDGMWRIDHADQDDDDLYISSIGRAVDVQEAYPFDGPGIGTNYDSYHFLFNKNAIGRAQAKVFLTCIGKKTEQSDGHQHALTVTIKPTQLDGGDDYTLSNAQKCPLNSFIAQTGYKITPSGSDPMPFVGHLSESWMSADNRGWSWDMDLSQDPGSSVTYYFSCVSRKLVAAGGENHKLVYRHQGPELNSVTGNKVVTRRIECKSHYKAVVAGFSFGPHDSAFGYDPNPDYTSYFLPKHWWLGMDPQPKNRDFKFLNSEAPSFNVNLRAICLNYRTT
jgi:hypothetical protein